LEQAFRRSLRLGRALRKDVREALLTTDDDLPVAYETVRRDAELAVPTPDHYMPLLYVIALRREGEPISSPAEGVDGGQFRC